MISHMLKKWWRHFDLTQPTGSTLGPNIPTPSCRILIDCHSAHSWHSHFTFKVKSIMKLETQKIQNVSIWCHQPKMGNIVSIYYILYFLNHCYNTLIEGVMVDKTVTAESNNKNPWLRVWSWL